MRFRAKASVGNSRGIFDAAYNFGLGAAPPNEAEMLGTPLEIGAEVARYLALLTPDDIQTMRYGTPQFFVEFIITPEGQPEDTIFTEGKPKPSED